MKTGQVTVSSYKISHKAFRKFIFRKIGGYEYLK
jgi:hypothetical protein